jgi:hypothetical protein
MVTTIFSTISGWSRGLFEFVSHLLTGHAFGILALLPGVVAIINLITVGSNFERLKAAAEKIAGKGKRAAPPAFVETAKELDDYRPRALYTIMGALCLTVVFEIVAAIGGGAGALKPYDFGVARLQSHRSSAAEAAALPPAGQAEQQIKDGGAADATGAESRPTVSGLAGLVYAGYGAFIYTLILVISRLNSSALTGQFLAVSSVRSAIALVLGFAAADTNLFSGLTTNQGLFVLFFIGLFPSWAMDAVRRKAQEIFKPREVGCDVLPLSLIDGLDDGIADRLAELGVWDIQHITAADPFALAAKSFYPIRRVIDWMDQAILISYARGQVVHFRAVGVRGAIDYAVLYQDAIGATEEIHEFDAPEKEAAYRKRLADNAAKIFEALAQKTGFSDASLNAIGRSFYEDPVVNYIWELWFSDDETGGAPRHSAESAGDGAAEPVNPPTPPSPPG